MTQSPDELLKITIFKQTQWKLNDNINDKNRKCRFGQDQS